MAFAEDLKNGYKGENIVFDILRENDLKPEFNTDIKTRKYFDLIDKNNTTYEIKTHFMAEKTGNLAFEIKSRGKPSGLSITNADVFVSLYKNKVAFLSTDYVRFLVYSKGKIVHGGDSNSSCLKIISIEDFEVIAENFGTIILLGDENYICK